MRTVDGSNRPRAAIGNGNKLLGSNELGVGRRAVAYGIPYRSTDDASFDSEMLPLSIELWHWANARESICKIMNIR